MVVQIHNAIVCAGRRGQAVGVLRIGEIAERDAVDGLVGVVVIGLQIVKAHCDHVVRHGSPVCHGCLNARRPLVVAVIVGETEHAEAQIIQRVGDLAGGGEHRIAAGGELVVDERLLIEPVHIKLVVADNYAADAQCDDRTGGKVVAVHSHISLPRSRSVIV